MKYVYLTLFVIVLGLPFALRHAAVETQTTPENEKAGLLKIVTVHNGDIRREFARAFDAWHRAHYSQSVVIEYRVPGGTSDMVRLLDSQKKQANGLHLVWGGGDYTFAKELKPLGIFQPIHLDPKLLAAAFPQEKIAGLALYDQEEKDSAGRPAPQWIGVALSSFGIVYNPQLYRTLGLPDPAAWSDLTNPKLFGFIALADPAHSGSASVSYMMVIQRAMADAEEGFFKAHPDLVSKQNQNPQSAGHGSQASPLNEGAKPSPARMKEIKARPDYQEAIGQGFGRGMGQLLLIAANARYFTDSSERVPTDVSRGEAAAGMAIDFT